MGWLDRFRAWIQRTEEKSNELEYGALDRLHQVEDRVDEATHGRFYDTLERTEEEAEELWDRAGLEDQDEPPRDAPAQPPRA